MIVVGCAAPLFLCRSTVSQALRNILSLLFPLPSPSLPTSTFTGQLHIAAVRRRL